MKLSPADPVAIDAAERLRRVQAALAFYTHSRVPVPPALRAKQASLLAATRALPEAVNR